MATPIGTKGNSVAAEYFRTIQDNRNYVSKQTKAAKKVAKASKEAAAPDTSSLREQIKAKMMKEVMAEIMGELFGGNDES